MDIYSKSIRHLRRKLRNEDFTRDEWDNYAHEQHLMSSIILMDKKKIASFEELKKKVLKEKEEMFLCNNDLYKEIKKLQRQLDKNIEQKGLNDEKTRLISMKVDRMINEYYDTVEDREYPQGSDIYNLYEVSYYMIKEQLINNNKFPTVNDWNKYARENGLLTSKTIEYISKLEWHLLETKLRRETNMMCYQKWKAERDEIDIK